MKRLSGGNLRAAGYDPTRRVLVVEMTSGTFEYGGVSADTFRRLTSASSPWSFFRDNNDEEYPAKRKRRRPRPPCPPHNVRGVRQVRPVLLVRFTGSSACGPQRRASS